MNEKIIEELDRLKNLHEDMKGFGADERTASMCEGWSRCCKHMTKFINELKQDKK